MRYTLGMDFSAEELFEAIDRLVAGLLERAGVDTPPVDALHLAREHLGIPVTIQSNRTEGDGPRHSRRRTISAQGGIILTADMTPTQRHKAAAEGIAQALAPQLCRQLGIPFDPQQKLFLGQLRTLFAPRLLVPTRMFRSAQRECQKDLLALHDVFSTASPEMIALRWLDLEEPCVVSIIDDGVVALRRSNCGVSGKQLFPAEQQCHDRIAQLGQPQRLRQMGWTVRGWPLPDRLGQRIVLHSIPDEV
jgi:predicted transcriptional regulator